METYTPKMIARIIVNKINAETSKCAIKIDCEEYVNNRYFGTWYDYFFKIELAKRNREHIWNIYENKIYRYENHYEGEENEELSVDNVCKTLSEYRSMKHASDVNGMAKHLHELLTKADYSLFIAKKIFIERPKFRSYHNFGGSIKPDFIIDNRIIDIKTYNKIKIKREDLVQLITYAIWVNNRHIIYNPENKSYRTDGYHYTKDIRFNDDKVDITEIGLFFSKHNYLWTKKLNNVWMFEGERFCREQRNSPTFKRFLNRVVEEVMVDAPRKSNKACKDKGDYNIELKRY